MSGSVSLSESLDGSSSVRIGGTGRDGCDECRSSDSYEAHGGREGGGRIKTSIYKARPTTFMHSPEAASSEGAAEANPHVPPFLYLTPTQFLHLTPITISCLFNARLNSVFTARSPNFSI